MRTRVERSLTMMSKTWPARLWGSIRVGTTGVWWPVIKVSHCRCKKVAPPVGPVGQAVTNPSPWSTLGAQEKTLWLDKYQRVSRRVSPLGAVPSVGPYTMRTLLLQLVTKVVTILMEGKGLPTAYPVMRGPIVWTPPSVVRVRRWTVRHPAGRGLSARSCCAAKRRPGKRRQPV